MSVILQNTLYKVHSIFFCKAVSTTCLKFDLDLSGDVFPRHSGDIIHGSSSNLPCLRGSHDWTRATYIPSREESGEGDKINTADAILPLPVATVTLRLLLPIWDYYYQFETTTINNLRLLLLVWDYYYQLLYYIFSPLHDSVPLLVSLSLYFLYIFFCPLFWWMYVCVWCGSYVLSQLVLSI